MAQTSPVFRILPTTQQYDWGKIGLSSKVAQFAAASKIPGFSLNEKAPYAELWMGTHPSSPSRLLLTNELLQKHLVANPQLIGQKVIERFDAADGNIPFLLKILAIQKALSIQTHPDKETAKVLHREHPDIYKDPNHKPEMALALTPFTALCGFLPLAKLASYISAVPEFKALIPQTIANKFISISTSSNPTGLEEKAALKDVFSAVMTADEGTFKAELSKLVSRYQQGDITDDEKDVTDLVLRLESQFPSDIGVFCAFMLNYVKLEPGEAIFLAAGEPHAYVTGDIVECMATSDNVIRAGLTPKLRDIPNLVSGLTYSASPPTKHYVQPTPFPRAVTFNTVVDLYDPPIPEFSVLQIKVPVKTSDKLGPELQPAIDGPSIAIVTEGKGTVEWGVKASNGGSISIGTGHVFFIGAGTEVELTADEGLVIYRAFVEAL